MQQTYQVVMIILDQIVSAEPAGVPSAASFTVTSKLDEKILLHKCKY